MMKKTVGYTGLFFFICCLVSCGQSVLEPVEYVKWVEDAAHGLVKSKEFDNIEFKMQLKTKDYILLKEENIDPHADKKGFEQEKNELGDLQYFTLKIKTPDGT